MMLPVWQTYQGDLKNNLKHQPELNSVMKTFYVYAYLRVNGTPYYIGKGSGRRAFRKHDHVGIPTDQERIVILEDNLSEIGALAIERRMIRWYGRKDINTGILRNLTDGGEGTSGYTVSIETRAKISAKKHGKPSNRKGVKLSDEHKKKIADSNRGVTRNIPPKSKEAIVKIQTAALDRVNSGSHNLKGKVTCRDKTGQVVMVDRNLYLMQEGDVANREYVNINSSEAKRRKQYHDRSTTITNVSALGDRWEPTSFSSENL